MTQVPINKEELAERFCDNGDVLEALNRYQDWFEYDLPLEEFKLLLLNSSPKNHNPKSYRVFPTMLEVHGQIEGDKTHLEKTSMAGNLSGTKVREYLEMLEKNDFKLADCFIVELWDDMNPSGSFFIRDGMHRLTAWALHSKLDPKFFPVKMFLGRNRIQDTKGKE